VIIRGLNAWVATSVHEHINQSCDDRKPRAPDTAGKETSHEIDDAFNPENLAGNKNQEQGQEDQVKEAAELVGIYEVECSLLEQPSAVDSLGPALLSN